MSSAEAKHAESSWIESGPVQHPDRRLKKLLIPLMFAGRYEGRLEAVDGPHALRNAYRQPISVVQRWRLAGDGSVPHYGARLTTFDVGSVPHCGVPPTTVDVV